MRWRNVVGGVKGEVVKCEVRVCAARFGLLPFIRAPFTDTTVLGGTGARMFN